MTLDGLLDARREQQQVLLGVGSALLDRLNARLDLAVVAPKDVGHFARSRGIAVRATRGERRVVHLPKLDETRCSVLQTFRLLRKYGLC